MQGQHGRGAQSAQALLRGGAGQPKHGFCRATRCCSAATEARCALQPGAANIYEVPDADEACPGGADEHRRTTRITVRGQALGRPHGLGREGRGEP